MSDLKDIAQNCSDSFYDVVNQSILITDLSNVIAASGPLKKKYLNKEISKDICEMIKNRSKTSDSNVNNLEIINGVSEESWIIVSPVLVSGDIVGAVIILSDTKITDLMEMTSDFIAKFLSRHLQ